MKKGTVDTAVSQNDSTYKGAIKFNPNSTISIKDTVGNPARALQYMVDGLERQDKRDDFVIDMGTYGDYGIIGKNLKKVCYGCAATCTIQEIAKKNFTYLTIGDYSLNKRKTTLNFYSIELASFEHAIENARRGNLYELYEFFNIYNTREEFYKDIIFKFSDVLLIDTCLFNKDLGASFYEDDYELNTNNWKKNLHLYKDLILLLIKCNPNWK